jgi:hypothetical protein
MMAGWKGGKGVADAPYFSTGYVTMQGVEASPFRAGSMDVVVWLKKT